MAAGEDWANLTGKRKNYTVLGCAEFVRESCDHLIMQRVAPYEPIGWQRALTQAEKSAFRRKSAQCAGNDWRGEER